MDIKIAVKKREDGILCVGFQGDSASDILFEKVESEVSIGDIYVGKVKNVVKNINAAFVEFKKDEMGYLPLKEADNFIYVSEKKSKKKYPVQGDEILVQVKQTAIKTKPPTLSGSIEYGNVYSVIVAESGIGGEDLSAEVSGAEGGPGAEAHLEEQRWGDLISISSKIRDKQIRENLKKKICEVFDEIQKETLENIEGEEDKNSQSFQNSLGIKFRVIARTNSGENLDKMADELRRKLKKFAALIEKGKHVTCFSCLKKGEYDFIKYIKGCDKNSLNKILVADEEIKEIIEDQVSEFSEKICVWDEENDGRLTDVLRMDKILEDALRNRVWLKSGAYLVIEHTEALNVIDVNTGKAISNKKNSEKTFFEVNCEAAKEALRQIRLRNLSGIIIIDFIDMKDDEMKNKVIDVLREEAKKDRVKCKVVDMTGLGLVEMTRQRVSQPIYEKFRRDGENR
ncbi:MAG: ribonuclease E/G [Lachnospiraceae bacterium]|nr:ribonuclease E/G [Lachnospiraceae bacterium]